MRDFNCPHCGNRLTFENSLCLSCSNALGFSLAERALKVLGSGDGGPEMKLCANTHVAACNWLVEDDPPVGGELCASCRLTTARPDDDDTVGLAEFATAEAAKRRLILELHELGLPVVGKDEDESGDSDVPAGSTSRGLAFELLSSAAHPVTTGHLDGVITIDLAEGDDVHREQMRVSMDEPYRTMLGHFRHEIGHYYFTVLACSPERLAQFDELFGDPGADYQEALDRHYSDGPPDGWRDKYVSAYATMHPAEDWAETFAHYLHIRDTLDTAAACAMAPAKAVLATPLAGPAAFDQIIELWLPLAWSLNMVNRSMGHPDLYPFVLAGPVLEKMRLVHEWCAAPAA